MTASTVTASTVTAQTLIDASPAAGLTLSGAEAYLLRSTARKVIVARESLVTELAAIRYDLEGAESCIAAGGMPHEGNFASQGSRADALVVKALALQEMFNEVAGTLAETARA